ncbi:MAG: DUF4256 domain-containing protein, partial [archaeon]
MRQTPTSTPSKKLSSKQEEELLQTLKTRFEKHKQRHPGIEWKSVHARLETRPGKRWSLYEMERTGGEPDVIGLDKKTGEYLFYDCSAESPAGRRSQCYDGEARNARKENKPKNSAMEMADEMGIEILAEENYR